MFSEQLIQQDEYFFKEDKRLFEILSWIDNHERELMEFGAVSRNKGKLPSECIDLLRSAYFFDLARSHDAGGEGLTSAAQARVLESLARIDGSISWCVMIGMDSGIYRGFLPESIREKYFPQPGIISAGWIHPQGIAIDLGNGTCRVSGKWQFASGIDNADVILGGVKFFENNDNDNWSWRIAVLDKTKIDIHETWDTWGLQGSGSQHYEAENIIIPSEQLFSLHHAYLSGPLFQPHDAILRKMAGIPLGVAVGAISSVVRSLEARFMQDRDAGREQNQRILNAIGRLTSDVLAQRASVYSTLNSAWDIYSSIDVSSEQKMVSLVTSAGARQRAFAVSRDIVIRACDLMGAQAVYKSKGNLGARLADANVMSQHAVGQESILEMVGNRIMGGDASGPFL